MIKFTGYDIDFLDAMRKQTDAAADDLIGYYFTDDTRKIELRTLLDRLTDNASLADLPGTWPLFKEAGQLPAWANTKLMDAGAVFFAQHAQMVMNLLALLSLPYCYAAADGARVLDRSERIKNNTEKRLLDTAQFVLDVMDPDAFSAAGKGFASILKVRLIHAGIRHYIKKDGSWDLAWGEPVNQEDMAGTNLSFSLIVIRGMRKLGYTISYEEQHAFMHLWNVIGYLLGVDERLLPASGKEAILLEKAIRKRHFRTSEHGRGLAASLGNFLQNSGLTPAQQKELPVQLMRFLLGDDVAGILDIRAKPLSPGVYYPMRLSAIFKGLRQPSAMAYRKHYARFSKLSQARKDAAIAFKLPEMLNK